MPLPILDASAHERVIESLLGVTCKIQIGKITIRDMPMRKTAASLAQFFGSAAGTGIDSPVWGEPLC